jgi:hypothetical protein
MPSVGFLTVDWARGTKPVEPNGCAWYRCYLPMLELEKLGWETNIGLPEFNTNLGFGVYKNSEEIIFGWDIVVFKLVMLRTVSQILDNPQRVNGQKIVVDVDDFFEGLQPSNYAYRSTDPEKNPDNNRNHYIDIIHKADAVITSTPFLYNYYKNEVGLKNVYLIRNAIDLPRWNQRKDHSRYLPVFGWVGATPWRSNDLETMHPFFGEFLQKNRLSFHHAGHIKEGLWAEHQLGIPQSVNVTHSLRKQITKYPEMFRKIDVGIVPLNNISFNHAKSTIKGLEYAASGIPFVASYSPEYELFAEDGIGRCAHSPEEWQTYLDLMIDPRNRKEEVERNLENISLHHTMEVRGHEWDSVLKQIMQQP